jgi:hypothetical protein
MVKLRSLAGFFLALVLLLACTKPRTQIILLIETDMPQGPRGRLTHIRIAVSQPGMPPRQRLTYRLGDETTAGLPNFYSLPGTLGISALDNDGSRSVEIKVDAVSDPEGEGTSVDAMFSYFAIAPFEEEKTLLLPVFLADRCRRAPPCDPGFTCGRERCERIQRTLTPIPADFRLDASALDATMEASLDATDDLQLSDATVDVQLLDATVSDILDVPLAEQPTCPPPSILCDGTCIDPRSNITHCGACGMRCTAGPNTNVACTMGRCERLCAAGFADCDGNPTNGCETDLRSNAAHCGACNVACSASGGTPSCASGMCRITCNAGRGDCDGNPANGCETDLADPNHCGACGVRCALPNVMRHGCSEGRCTIVACAPGRGDCDRRADNGCEVDLTANGAHCSACGQACQTGYVCNAGICTLSCGTNLTVCGSACVDTQTNSGHCGRCDNACPTRPNTTSSTCNAGTCGFVCANGFADCDGDATNGCEVDLQNDPNRCGSCMRRCTAANASVQCRAGNCQLGACTAGFGNCDGNPTNGCETDLRSTLNHCGACGALCSVPNASPICAMGVCGYSACTMGFGDCDGNRTNGCETDLNSNPSHCGACGRACASPNATPSCSAGVCGYTICNAGFGDCDGNRANGCETNTQTSPLHCGACGRACAPSNATPACTMGVCGYSTCTAGFADCNMNPADGCETNTQTTGAHCGACGRACPPGQVCSCTLVCGPGFTNCGGACVETASNPAHCGRCDNGCATPPNATRTCTGGTCGFTCTAGFADCNMNPADGCEVNTQTATAHCGGCGRVCAPANATPACTMGVCGYTVCNPGFADCDGNRANGCETDLNSNPSHCGACGRACAPANATPACTMGVCSYTVCNAGFGDCDGNRANGCETDLNSNPSHCGRCNNVCPTPPNATRTCTRGTCGFTCTAGFADCNMNPVDGCEVNTQTDTAHCGRCNNVCPTPPNATRTCTRGMCGFSCNRGFADCNTNPADGCELEEGSPCTMHSGCTEGVQTCLLGTPICDPRHWLLCGTPCPRSMGIGVCDGRGMCTRVPIFCDGGVSPADGGGLPFDSGHEGGRPFDGSIFPEDGGLDGHIP